MFAKQWDFRGRLQIAYQEGSIAADIAAEALHAGPRRLTLQMTFLGNRTTRSYPYGPQLLVYDFRDRRVHVLRDESAARRYVTAERPRFTCSPLRSFAWGLDPTGRFSLP